jgi:hypothetical protein
MTFLKRVDVPEICFLKEVLFWVAFRRLPVTIYDLDGNEMRNGGDIGGYAVELTDIPDWLEDEECASANIPPDPRYAAAVRGETSRSLKDLDDLLARIDLNDPVRLSLNSERDEAVAQEKQMEPWFLQYQDAIEYPASKIFVALKDGRLKAKGRLLPEDVDVDVLNEDIDIFDSPVVEIPAAFWSLKGIDFEESSADDDYSHYYHIRCQVTEVFSVFPGDYEPVSEVGQFGPNFLIKDATATRRIPNARQRGRPSYPWDAFHLEVATLIYKGQLPAKKEACIQYMQDWFRRTLSIGPSRAAIGEKLKPYYDRFARIPDRK